MKTIYIKILMILGLVSTIISCKAQTLPLNTALANIPANAYVKDINNELVPYIGTYKTNYQGNEISLFITKVDNRLESRAKKQFYRDALVVKYIVKNNSSGVILQDTTNNNLPEIDLHSTKMNSQNSVIFYYSGTNCGVGWGSIFLKKINATQLSWEYRPEDIILMPGKCPPGTDTTIYLPETKDLIFTKQ